MFETLYQKITATIPLTLEDKALGEQYFEPITATKASLLARQGHPPSHLYFIQEGFMRLFYINEKGVEVTTRICGAGDFITPYLSYIHQKPAKVNTQAITDVILLGLSPGSLQALISKSTYWQQFSLIIFEQAIETIEQRADDLATLTATERYAKLLLHFPTVLQYVPIQYIASFLGMKPESLSRIRKQMTKKQ